MELYFFGLVGSGFDLADRVDVVHSRHLDVKCASFAILARDPNTPAHCLNRRSQKIYPKSCPADFTGIAIVNAVKFLE